jgi:FkbM family methyltransferase
MKKLFKEFSVVWQIAGWLGFAEYVMQIILNSSTVIRTKNFAAADLGMGGRRRTFKVYEQLISLDGSLFGAAREIYGRQVYFALPGFTLKPEDVVVDLGANVGVFTTLAARLGKKVIAVEAQSGFIDCIYSNLRENNCSDKAFVEFGIIGANAGLFSDQKRLEESSHYGEVPPTLSMDDIIERHHIQNINFLKIDIEGSEFDLFKGNTGWLSCVERIAMEVHLDSGNVEDLVAVLEGKGFAVQLVDNQQKNVETIKGLGGYLFAKRNPQGSII